jgi:hypothetical protein
MRMDKRETEGDDANSGDVASVFARKVENSTQVQSKCERGSKASRLDAVLTNLDTSKHISIPTRVSSFP